MSKGSPACLDFARHERKGFEPKPRSYRALRHAQGKRSRDTPRSLRLAGYAALFGIPDADRDTILPGAFAATLAARTEKLPLYWQHRPGQRIGWVETAREDAKGLRVIATLDSGTRPGELLAAREVSGLSFGYRAADFRLTPRGRELAAVELFEVSLVTHPLQHGARVHFVDPPRDGEVAAAGGG